MTLSVEASQEAALEDLLDHINSKWSSIDFTLIPFKDMKDAFILGSLEDVTAALEDSMVTMSTILASRQVHLACTNKSVVGALLHTPRLLPRLKHGSHLLLWQTASSLLLHWCDISRGWQFSP